MMSAPRVLIIGVSGMLGNALAEELHRSCSCTGVGRTLKKPVPVPFVPCDITSPCFDDILEQQRPDIIINAAAWVDVDACEGDERTARAIHEEATARMAAYCQRKGAYLVYVSTDSVFDGTMARPYRETDSPAPLNVYSRTKLAGERAALVCRNSLVLRANIFGWTTSGRNFAEWVLQSLRAGKQITVFTDVLITPLFSGEYARIIGQCLQKRPRGIFHAGSRESISKAAFAQSVASLYGLSSAGLRPGPLAAVPLRAQRPKNMALDSTALAQELGMTMPDVMTSLEAWKRSEPLAQDAYTPVHP